MNLGIAGENLLFLVFLNTCNLEKNIFFLKLKVRIKFDYDKITEI